ncbi:MAG TPA: hypothetical protein VN455_06840, partial [Methanotrichaceae archaeon]|nr:hypothetical protein [Methanotrichaceae archaeon]
MPASPNHRFLCTFFCLLILAGIWTISTKAEEGRPQVLILNSCSQGSSWTDDEMNGFMEAYHNEAPGASDPMVEYMDWYRYPEDENSKHLLDLYRYRYSGKRIDEVVIFGRPALAFALERWGELFPNARLIFAGIDTLNDSIITGKDRIAGVVARPDIAGTIEVMLQLHPGARQVLVVRDSSEEGDIFR